MSRPLYSVLATAFALMLFRDSANGAVLVTPTTTLGVRVRETISTKDLRNVQYVLPYGHRLRADDKPVNGWYRVWLPFADKTQRGYAFAKILREIPEDQVDFEVHFVDVGSGDAVVVRAGETNVIIDGGDNPNYLMNYIRKHRLLRGAVELVVLSHREADHWTGLNRLVGRYGGISPVIKAFWMPDADSETRCRNRDFDAFSRAVSRLGRRGTTVSAYPASGPGYLPYAPEISIQVLHRSPSADTPADCDARTDNSSIVFLMSVGTSRFLMTGDITGKEVTNFANVSPPKYVEGTLVAQYKKLLGTVDVVKVPHHGDDTASTGKFIDSFLAATRRAPLFAIISANTKQHMPKARVVKRWEDAGAIVLRTDRDIHQGNDHIVCVKNRDKPLNCNYAFVLAE